MTHLTLVRHGQSDWNEKNLFTGWENPGLTKQGLKEARETGEALKEIGLTYSYLYTSVLDRAIVVPKFFLVIAKPSITVNTICPRLAMSNQNIKVFAGINERSLSRSMRTKSKTKEGRRP